MMPKAPGSEVFSGAINGERALTLRATRLAVDSRYARIMSVMRDSEQRRPQLRRLGDQLGAWYTPIALGARPRRLDVERRPVRFLAVLVVATPCPLLIGIPWRSSAPSRSRQSAASSSAIRAVLERIDAAARSILDKTGTLTYGQPALTDRLTAAGIDDERGPAARCEPGALLQASAGQADRRSRSARHLALLDASEVRERPGRRTARARSTAGSAHHRTPPGRGCGIRRCASRSRNRPRMRDPA